MIWVIRVIRYNVNSFCKTNSTEWQRQQMAEHAASLMLRRIEEPEAAPKRIIIDPKLIIRGTTASYIPD